MGQRLDRLVAQEDGVSRAAINVLVTLARSEASMSHRDLARRCWIRPASLTRIVDGLARAGLVERRRDDRDRRVVRISLTAEGDRQARQVLARLGDHFPSAHPAELDQHDQATIRAYLIHLITAGEETR